MKRDKTAGNENDANSVLKKHLSAAQRKRRKRIITIIVVAVLIVAAVTFVVIKLRDSVSSKYASSKSSVESTTVTVGSISSTISGSGTLTDDDVEEVEVPTSVTIDTVYVEEGDTVKKGDKIASVNTASVVSAMADIQDQIDEIDAELENVSGETVSNKITAGISGRVKKIFAEKGNDVATVMYDKGALMLISLDGLMAADIKTDAKIVAGDAVSVTLSGGSTLSGTVQKVKDGVVTVTVTDNGTEYGDAVTVKDANGNELGTGTLYIHSEFKITGYAGTISKVYVAENKKVSASTKLFYLTDTSYTASYDTLLEERASLEDDLDELIKLYKEGAVFSPISGVVYSVDYDEDISNSASSNNSASSTGTSSTGTSNTGTSSTGTSGTGTSGTGTSSTGTSSTGTSSTGTSNTGTSSAGTSSTGTSTASTSTNTSAAASDDHTTVVTVCPNATMSVTVNIDESDILSLKEGQEASVTIDSIGDDKFSGTVSEVNTTGTSSGGVTVFTVEVTIDKTEKMLAGMSATVDIKIEGVEKALLIPSDALQQTSTTSYVYTEYNEKTGKLGGMVEVETGLDNGTNVEITSGLSEGDTVYYDTSSDESESQSRFGYMQPGAMPSGMQGPQAPQNGGGGMPGSNG